jgi:hypothetical protein
MAAASISTSFGMAHPPMAGRLAPSMRLAATCIKAVWLTAWPRPGPR